MSAYKCSEGMRSYNNPEVILTHVLNLVDVRSAIDVGCGLGIWGETLVRHGIDEVYFMDAHWYEEETLSLHIDMSHFIVHDLEDGVYDGKRTYDLAICLEVAEHVSPKNELNVVETLVGLSDCILFSAAIPRQGGDGHVNEQWPSYWRALFRRYGYDFADVIRPLIWSDASLYKWYRQNTFVVAKENLLPDIYRRYGELGAESQMTDVVHPEYYFKSYGKSPDRVCH